MTLRRTANGVPASAGADGRSHPGAVGRTRRRGRCFAALVAVVAAVAGCATGAPVEDARVWDSRAGRFVGIAEVHARLARTRIVLLGESHDNARHHALQADLLQRLVATGARPALVMEQFDTEHQMAIADAQRTAQLGAVHRAARPDPDAVADAGQLDRKGWEWPFYRPLVAIALEHSLPIVAGNLSRTAARRVMSDGFDALGAGRARELGLPPGLGAAAADALRHEIVEGHCGMLPSGVADSMVRAQQARDAVMADALFTHRERGAVLIAGSGHVRRDFGVPFYLAARSVESLSIGFVEMPANGATDAVIAAAAQRFDYVWLTPHLARPDPCAEMRRSIKPVAPPVRLQ